MTQKIAALLLTVLMLFSLTACQKYDGEGIEAQFDYLIKGYENESVALGTPDVSLDPQAVYDRLTYTPEMFYGDYRLLGEEDAQQRHASNSEYFTVQLEGETLELTALPFRIKAGSDNIDYTVTQLDDHQWILLYFMRKLESGDPTLYTVLGAYTVEGNTISITLVDHWETDEAGKATYALSDTTLEYTFAFSGRKLTFSTANASVVMTCGLAPDGDMVYMHVDHYVTAGTNRLDGIERINFRLATESYLYFESESGEEIRNAVIKIYETGLMTFTIPWASGTKTYEYVYFYCDQEGIILTDGYTVYSYAHDYSEYTNS